MGLKAIEIQGFKSFKNKVKLNFDNKVTAIVGPNGSGKSNVSDAIVWVLGEQSAKKLRGTSMQDIIFSGTEKYKPVNFVQVDISFENDMWPNLEYRELTISRRAFRNGENEYFINKSPVRLKDIRSLFMDTGIGKDGYSVIGQGKIEEIISSKSEDRRIVFEEAAGISKHKYNKEQSLKKLEKTNENLSRVEDILIQEEDRLAYLYKESQKAEKAIEIKKRLKTLEFDKAKEDISNLKDKLNILVEKRLLVDRDKKENESLLDEKSRSLGILKSQIKDIELTLNTCLNEKNELINKNIKDNAEISIINLRIENNNKEIDRLSKDNESLEKNIVEFEEKLRTISKDKRSLEDKLSKIKLDDSKIEELNIGLKKLRDEYKSCEDELEKNKLDFENLMIAKNSFMAIEKQRTEFDSQNKVKLEENKRLLAENSSKLDYYKKSLREIDEKIAVLDKEIEDFEKISLKEGQALEAYRNSFISIQNDYNKEKNTYSFLKNVLDNHEDYNRTVQDFFKKLTTSDLRELAIGTLGDLITIDKRYHKAADAILQAAYNNIIVEDEYQAKDLINFLREKKIGRLTFLPISKIHPKNLSYIDDEKVINHLNRLIETDAKYRDIVDNLTQKTLVVVNMDDAIEVSNKYKAYRIVSLEGDLINSWGSIVGGYKKNYSYSVLDRKNELAQAKKKLLALNDKLKSLKDLIEDKNKSKTDREELLRQKNLVRKELLTEKEDINRQIIRLESQIQVYQNGIYDLENKFSYQDGYKFSQEDEESLNKLDGLIKKNLKNLEALKDKIVIWEEKLQEEKLDNLRVNSEYSAINRDLNITINQEDDLKSKMENSKDNIEANTKSLYQLKNDLEKLELSLEGLGIDSENFEEELSNKEEKIKSLQEQVEDKKSYLEELNDLIVDYRTKKETFKASKENIIKRSKETCLAINDIKRKILDNYASNIDSYEKKSDKVDKKEIDNLNSKLISIGSYSQASIGEYKKVKEHNDLLKKNKDELITSRNDILKAINKLNREIKDIFTNKFNQINKEFQEVFSNLFNGGYARLELTDDDILNSGVEIIAQPPGKKLQNLSLLSGGEKSLTAIALLFAIFKTKPAPFCVLDEIDAALDEINIKRFKKYILEFSSEIQFIVITHRKSTMEIADILYGVNMEENGVSSIITLDIDRGKLC